MDERYGLAIETSTRTGTITLGRIGEADVAEALVTVVLSESRRHNVDLVAMVAELLDEKGVAKGAIAEVYVSVGPGSFTGLRVGIATAKMMAFAMGSRVVAVETIAAVGRNLDLFDAGKAGIEDGGRVVVGLSPKRGAMWTATFVRGANGKFEMEGEAGLRTVGEILQDEKVRELGVLAELGDDLERVEDAVKRVLPERLLVPRSEAVFAIGREKARRGEFVDASVIEPVYVRPPEAVELWAARHGDG